MLKKINIALFLAIALVVLPQPTWARGGRGGGGFGGGGGFHGGFGGGGAGGGFHGLEGGGGFHGLSGGGGEFHGLQGGGLGGGGEFHGLQGGGLGGGGEFHGLGGGGFNGGAALNRGGGFDRGGFNRGQFGGLGGDGFHDRSGGLDGGGARPTRSQLGNFLGLPGDGGMHNLSGETQNRGSQIYDNVRAGDGAGHNFISGETQSPGSRVYDQLRTGNNNFIHGETQSRGSQIYSNIRTGDKQFNQFNNNIIHGETQSFGSRAYDYARQNHPLQPISPWRNHNNAVVIRRNFNNYNYFSPGWYRRYPAAWYPSVWAYGYNPWYYVPWPSLSGWMGYPSAQPVYYSYGTNVVYQNNTVIVNGQSVGTPAEYYQQAQDLAEQGDQKASKDEKWMPLGVFALSHGDQTSSNLIIQLAVNKQGIIRGNYTDRASGEVQVVQGSVDKQTQRACWTIGKNENTVFDTGIYNLTKEQTNVMVHFSDKSTEQWLMVRLDKKDQPDGDGQDQGDQSNGSTGE